MILDAFRLDGRVALITGASRGMGQAMACALAEAGADIMVVDVADIAETEGQIQQRGRRCASARADLMEATPELAAELIGECVSALGRLDILINNAGITRRVTALELPAEDWNAVLQVDLNALFYLSQAAGRHFVAAGKPGKIINLASMLSFQGGFGVPAYAAAKSAVLGLTRALANEWARHGINVNAIAPGWIATEFTSVLRNNPEMYQRIHGRIPAGRWGKATDVQGTAIFLASDAAEYLHGAVIPVDGGWLAW